MFQSVASSLRFSPHRQKHRQTDRKVATDKWASATRTKMDAFLLGMVGFRNPKWVTKIYAAKNEVTVEEAPWQHIFYKVTPEIGKKFA